MAVVVVVVVVGGGRVECLGWRATIRRDRQKVHGQMRLCVERQCSARWSSARAGRALGEVQGCSAGGRQVQAKW
ncbi:hypothetical protein J1614_004958 [Plenodomus biglobosus]|nr:hypothetical protein J1614_004958 [Plenodomus biglobosus]